MKEHELLAAYGVPRDAFAYQTRACATPQCEGEPKLGVLFCDTCAVRMAAKNKKKT